MKKEMQTFYNMRPSPWLLSPQSDWNYNWHFIFIVQMFGKKVWISEHPGAEHRMHLVRKVSARPIHQWSRMGCVSVGQGWPTLCVCVCYRRCGGEFYPQRIQCQWPITRIITEFLPSVLRDKRVIWENVIGVIASSVWACKLYEGWACLSVLVKVKLELHVSYHMYCPPFFLKLWHKKSIKPFFSSNCHHSLTTSLSPRYQGQR